MTRRTFLGTAAAIGAATCVPALAAPPSRRLIVGRRTIEVLGKSAEVYGVTDGREEAAAALRHHRHRSARPRPLTASRKQSSGARQTTCRALRFAVCVGA
jgi:hypothetical protein